MVDFMQFAINGILVGGLYALVGVSIVLVFKATQVVSLAHGQLLAFGALFFWIFLDQLNFPVWMALLGTISLAALMGFITERFTIRPLIGESLFTAFLMTFSVFMFLDGFFQLYLSGQSRAYSPFLPEGEFNLSGLIISKGLLSSFTIAMLIFVGLFAFFKFTRTGLQMRATSENHILAQSAGIGVKKVFTLIWIISSAVVAVGGIACANVMDIHYPLPYIGIKGLIVAMFGGLESIGGALMAGILLGLIENLSSGYLDGPLGGGVKDAAAYVILLLILIVKPYGLFGLKKIERI